MSEFTNYFFVRANDEAEVAGALRKARLRGRIEASDSDSTTGPWLILLGTGLKLPSLAKSFDVAGFIHVEEDGESGTLEIQLKGSPLKWSFSEASRPVRPRNIRKLTAALRIDGDSLQNIDGIWALLKALGIPGLALLDQNLESSLSVTPHRGELRRLNGFYSTDDRKIFLEGAAIEGADPKSFQILSFRYTRDRNHAYFNHKRIENVDLATFRCAGLYAQDKAHVWHDGGLLEGVDASSFHVWEQPENYDYGADSHRIFCHGRMIEGADRATFKPLGMGYARDRENVFFLHLKLKGADPATFKPLKLFGRGEDRHRKYYREGPA